MRRALWMVLLLLLAGCTSSPPPQDDQPPPYAFTSSRVDTDGDGLYDAVNLTLVAAPGTLSADLIAFERNHEPVVPMRGATEDGWSSGEAVLLACPPGSHEFRVLIDGVAKKVVVHECGVPAPELPPAFEGRVLDGDADGRTDTIQLRLIQGGPVDPLVINATMGNTTLRLYDSPLKSQVARSPLGDGGRVFTPCVPQGSPLELVWRGQALPALELTGCDVFQPGIDAPVLVDEVDADGDQIQDGWNLTLGAPTDGPFNLSQVNVTWQGGPAQVNGSLGLSPPPNPWAPGTTLVVPCPASGRETLTVRIQGQLAFRIGETHCERAPGHPLISLELDENRRELEALLTFSRVGALDATNLTTPDGAPVGEGLWAVDEVRTLSCPGGGNLTLLYQGRLAFRGPAPC